MASRAHHIAKDLHHAVHAKRERHRLEAAAYFTIIVLEFWTAITESGLPNYLFQAAYPAHERPAHHLKVNATYYPEA